ncbi:hypothetical protein K435DRAFT_856909 [Dendrothele bispora CBS 962.96]|uniref:Uncharacterized protein n=1 Tax=Dendrothele bispora (strain CBS 962.96) TaxID=1314807 RepID=A0A4S8M8K4_DENBC|nr:hypothetical protein K435DRAFT_856909 [Dendrothele bispora CBS 962.96]
MTKTEAAEKIWDDPAYFYIVLKENDGQTGATVQGLTDSAQSGLERADFSTVNGGLDEVMISPEYEEVNEEPLPPRALSPTFSHVTTTQGPCLLFLLNHHPFRRHHWRHHRSVPRQTLRHLRVEMNLPLAPASSQSPPKPTKSNSETDYRSTVSHLNPSWLILPHTTSFDVSWTSLGCIVLKGKVLE